MTERVFRLSRCPHLPVATEDMDYRILGNLGDRRDEVFYEAALRYGQHLWRCGHAGRALLALTRALYAEMDGSEKILRTHPLPYRAMAWILQNHSSDDFPGNPRLSYQHQALRMRGARKELRQARAWAVWALVCAIRPHLPGDTTLEEIPIIEIAVQLEKQGIPGERALWEKILAEVSELTSKN